MVRKRLYFCNPNSPRTRGDGKSGRKGAVRGGSSLKEWNDVANGSKDFERFASDKVGTDKKQEEIN